MIFYWIEHNTCTVKKSIWFWESRNVKKELDKAVSSNIFLFRLLKLFKTLLRPKQLLRWVTQKETEEKSRLLAKSRLWLRELKIKRFAHWLTVGEQQRAHGEAERRGQWGGGRNFVVHGRGNGQRLGPVVLFLAESADAGRVHRRCADRVHRVGLQVGNNKQWTNFCNIIISSITHVRKVVNLIYFMFLFNFIISLIIKN